MGCCYSTTNQPIDEDAPVSVKQAKRLQKAPLHSGLSSDDIFDETEKAPKQKKGGRKYLRSSSESNEVDDDDDDGAVPACGLHVSMPCAAQHSSAGSSSASAVAAAAEAAAAAAAAAEAEAAARALAEEEARLAAEEAARLAAEEAARAKVAEAAAHAAKLNSALATRLASSKPKSNAQALATKASLDLHNELAAFDAFVKWEDDVQKAAAAILGSKFAKAAKKNAARAKGKHADAASLFTLLAMEEQTRNSSFVAALQTRELSRPLQGKALRCVPTLIARPLYTPNCWKLTVGVCGACALRSYTMLCDNILNKLTRRLPTIGADSAPLVSAYLSKVSQHRDLSRAARPDGFVGS